MYLVFLNYGYQSEKLIAETPSLNGAIDRAFEEALDIGIDDVVEVITFAESGKALYHFVLRGDK